MSMPSSRVDVATSAGSRPALRSSSIWSRCSRAMLPWWARTSSSPASSLRRCASRSASRRLFVKTIVLRWARISSRIRGWIAGQMLVRRSPLAAGPARLLLRRDALAHRRHVLDRHDHLEVERLAHPGIDDRDLAARPDAAEEPGDRLERPLRGRQADPLERSGRGARPVPERREALERQREMRSALRAGDRVDLVDDDRLDAAQRLAGRAREQQVEALRRRHEDVRRPLRELAPILLWACRRSGSRSRSAAPARRAGSRRARCRAAGPGGCARRRRSAP